MFKVRCKLIKFEGNEALYPCHFNYKIGDEFYYDGVYFSGRICPGLMASMMPIIYGFYVLGNKYAENVLFRYRNPDGIEVRDPSMAKYDGAGFRHLKSNAEVTPKDELVISYNPKTGKARGGHFMCADGRTLAHFICEPVDLCDSEYAQPFYRREIAVLSKIEAEPGIKIADILDRFSDFEKNEIAPPLTPVLLEVIIDALVDMEYVDVKEGRAFATGRQPPSRPKIG